jgi:hypothetical protein
LSLSTKVETAMSDAVAHLTNILRCELLDATTHRTLIVEGWNLDARARDAIAQYLVGLRACAIDAALHIRAQLEDNQTDRMELLRNIYAIVGKDDTALSEDQKRDERNPWIAEGIWHLCMVISCRRPEMHPLGTIVALDYAHVATKDHGFDVAGLYTTDGAFGLSLVESKAYKDGPNRAISRSVEFFRSVDRDEQALRIRQSVQIMRSALPLEQQNLISGSFWKRTRAYLPNPHYDADCRVDWAIDRPSFLELQPGKMNILVMPHIIEDFDAFFDQIARGMRTFAEGLINV